MPAVIFARQSYQSKALPAQAQRLLNYFAENNPDNPAEPVTLLGTDGVAASVDLSGQAVRAMQAMGDYLYAVVDTTVWRIDSAGSTTNLGSINDDGNPCRHAHDGTNWVILSGSRGWVATSSTLTEITDADFKASKDVTWQDGRFIFIEDGTDSFFISATNNPLAYDATEFASAEGSPDDLVAIVSDRRQVVLFGEQTTEFFFNSGNVDFPFERIQGAVMEVGCGATGSVARLDNTIFWLANDRTVRQANGLDPVQISTFGIESQIEALDSISNAEGFAYSKGGHQFYVLRFPGFHTFVYDARTGLWHDRGSYDRNDWRVTCHAEAFGNHYVGDALSGKIGKLDTDTHTEWSDTIISSATSGPFVDATNRLAKFRNLEFVMNSGTTIGSSDPQIVLDWSDDGGRTFSEFKPQQSLGKQGEFAKRVRFTRLGSSRRRVFRVTVSDAARRDIIGAYADVT